MSDAEDAVAYLTRQERALKALVEAVAPWAEQVDYGAELEGWNGADAEHQRAELAEAYREAVDVLKPPPPPTPEQEALREAAMHLDDVQLVEDLVGIAGKLRGFESDEDRERYRARVWEQRNPPNEGGGGDG